MTIISIPNELSNADAARLRAEWEHQVRPAVIHYGARYVHLVAAHSDLDWKRPFTTFAKRGPRRIMRHAYRHARTYGLDASGARFVVTQMAQAMAWEKGR